MKRSCTSLVLEEIVLAKVIRRSELNEICRGKCRSSSITRMILHYLSKLKLVYLTSNGYIVLLPWLMYLKELYGDGWFDVFRRFLRRSKIVIVYTELDDIKYLVENHPVKSLYDFVKVHLKFRDYVDKLTEIPSRIIPEYCRRYDFEGKDPQEIYLSCIAPLLALSSWVLELLAELIREVAMHPDPKRVVTTFFEVRKEASSIKDFYSEVLERLKELVHFVVSIKSVEEDPVEKVISEYSEKMKISYDERSYIRNLLRFIVLSRL
jgi:uncharacterized protein YdhG (YjbR/CyaY superfamily)